MTNLCFFTMSPAVVWQAGRGVPVLGALGFEVTLCRIPGPDPGPEAN
jgi:hypothetical protein